MTVRVKLRANKSAPVCSEAAYSNAIVRLMIMGDIGMLRRAFYDLAHGRLLDQWSDFRSMPMVKLMLPTRVNSNSLTPSNNLL